MLWASAHCWYKIISSMWTRGWVSYFFLWWTTCKKKKNFNINVGRLAQWQTPKEVFRAPRPSFSDSWFHLQWTLSKYSLGQLFFNLMIKIIYLKCYFQTWATFSDLQTQISTKLSSTLSLQKVKAFQLSKLKSGTHTKSNLALIWKHFAVMVCGF